jgi:pentatricopeptide repeat protein
MSPSKGRMKRRKRSHDQSAEARDGSSKLPAAASQNSRKPKHPLHHRQVDRQKIHEEKLALSQQLRQLSSQKRLRECVDLYESAVNNELRDVHHGSIVIDCCARCGDINEAERIVNSMLSQQTSLKSQKEETMHQHSCFWEDHRQISYTKVPIQAWTALMKGYVHSGMMAKAYSLFEHLCGASRSAISAIDGEGGEKKNRKKRKVGEAEGPNVRTFNTLLRGCLWTATSLTFGDSSNESKNEIVGGIVDAGRAWLLCKDINITSDSSSYEYYITMLSQSLQCRAAENCFLEMTNDFGIRDDINVGQNVIRLPSDFDATVIESFVVCLVAIARGFALLGKVKDVRRCAEGALSYLDVSSACKNSASLSVDFPTANKQTTGGKKAWRDGLANVNSKVDVNATGRRVESNRLFRNHRLSELRSEASALRDLVISRSDKYKEYIATQNALFIAQMMMTRLLYFSGGGTTSRESMKLIPSATEVNVETDTQRWIHSLWHSFGLRETVQRLLDDKHKVMEHFFPHTSMLSKDSRSDVVLSKESCKSLRAHVMGEDSVICTNSGRIRFASVFTSLNGNASVSVPEQNKPLHIELGAGSGDWACLQAELNPSDNYVTVELRADRVAKTFSKCLLHCEQTGGQNTNIPLMNVCCVGSECGSFLRDRVAIGSVKTIFVNHPEPPTQTYNKTSSSADEPAHMLNSQTISSASRCLEPMGKGMLVVVTDNLTYARLICQLLVRMLRGEIDLVGLSPGEVRDLNMIESFGSSICLYEGKPSLSIRHFTPKRVEGGHSYFDRLWRTGAGKHAEMRKRFIIVLRTKVTEARQEKSSNDGEENKSTKKKGLEKQMRRNERRLLKKQQLEQKKGD